MRNVDVSGMCKNGHTKPVMLANGIGRTCAQCRAEEMIRRKEANPGGCGTCVTRMPRPGYKCCDRCIGRAKDHYARKKQANG
jgi:hypothetical protein